MGSSSSPTPTRSARCARWASARASSPASRRAACSSPRPGWHGRWNMARSSRCWPTVAGSTSPRASGRATWPRWARTWRRAAGGRAGAGGGGGLDGGSALRFHALANAAASPYRYLIDPGEQLHVMLAIDDADEVVWGIFHSHVRSPAEPSPTDIGLAFYPAALSP